MPNIGQRGFDLRRTRRWFLLCGLVGVSVGLAAILLHYLCLLSMQFFLAGIGGYYAPETELEAPEGGVLLWYLLPVLLVLPAFGGLVCGILNRVFTRAFKEHGTDAAIDAYHNKRGIIPANVTFTNIFSSAMVIGTGGSTGCEGPIALTGSGIGSQIGNVLKLNEFERRTLLAAGMGAGIGAIFKAPMAGAIMAAEILYREPDMESEVLFPAFFASIIAYSVFLVYSTPTAIFTMKRFYFSDPRELIPFAVLGIALALISILYVTLFSKAQEKFEGLKMHPIFKPALGGLLTGALAVSLYLMMGKDTNMLSTLAYGYGPLQEALTNTGALGLKTLALLMVGKMLTSTFSIASGGSGGIFGPAIVIGGCLGGIIGLSTQHFFPSLVTQPESFVLVGMAGFFACVGNTPLSSIIMVGELSGNYGLMVPSMLVCSLGYYLAQHWTMFHSQVKNRLESPAHQGDFSASVLELISLSDIYEKRNGLETIHESTQFKEFLPRILHCHQDYFPVIDEKNNLVGMISINDVRSIVDDHDYDNLLVARDLATTDLITVREDESIQSVVKKFTMKNLAELPVVDPNDTSKLLGMISRRHLISAYNRILAQRNPRS